MAGLGFIKLTGKIIYVGLNFYNFLFIAYNSCDIYECQLYRKSWTLSDGWGLGEKIWKNQSSYSFYILHLIKRFYKFYIFHSIIIWWQLEIVQVIQQCNNAEVGQVMHSLTNFVNVPVLLFWLCASNVCSFASCIYCIWKYYIIYIHNRACLFTPPFFGNMNTPKQITFDCQKCQIGSSLCNIYLLMW